MACQCYTLEVRIKTLEKDLAEIKELLKSKTLEPKKCPHKPGRQLFYALSGQGYKVCSYCGDRLY